MEPIVLNKVLALPDVLTNNHFNFFVGSVPGGGDAEALNIQNMSAVLPMVRNQPMPVELHRHKRNFAGKREYTQSFTARFVDTLASPVLRALRDWQAQINEPGTNLPRPSIAYQTQALVEVYGADNSIVERRVFNNIWVSNVEEPQLTGSGNEPLEISVTFTYDTWDYAN